MGVGSLKAAAKLKLAPP